MKKNILMTGSTGFVGKKLLDKIGGKYQINTFSGKTRVDLKDKEDVFDITKNKDIVIHLAYSKNYPENIIITKNLIEACKKNKIKKILILSSMSAKREKPDKYGKNKLYIEKLIKESKLNYTILRPSIIYGSGSSSFNFIIDYMNKIPFFTPIIGNGKYFIYPIHVNDVIQSIISCIDSEKTNKKEYDIVGRDRIYFIELINMLKKQLKSNKINIYIPIFVCKIISYIFPKIINKENIENLSEDSKPELLEAKKDFNFNPIKFKEGIKNGLI
ncbi:MAG: NAD(P)H-binding protein [Candidatus Pacearchaeota archaeon]|nr:NAD(P)H-binding protein [Candidatus Pacearchaeota archaeon]